MIRIAVCDDEPVVLQNMRQMLDHFLYEKKLNFQITTVRNGEELLTDIDQHGSFQIIFLDIELMQMDGIEAAQKLRAEDPYVILIFISAHSEYYRAAFDVQPFQFLDKPISVNQLYSTLDKVLLRIQNDSEVLSIYYKRMYYSIPIREIIYLESVKRMIRAVMVSGEIEFYDKLERLEDQLLCCQQQFIRIHQSYLVNTYHIRELGYSNVKMSNGVELSISRENKRYVREYYMKWLGGESF